jgi:hypothetical protein
VARGLSSKVAVNAYLKEYKNALDEFNKMSGGMDIDNYDERLVIVDSVGKFRFKAKFLAKPKIWGLL